MVWRKTIKYFDIRDHLCLKTISLLLSSQSRCFLESRFATVSNKYVFTIKIEKHVKFWMVGISVLSSYIYDSNRKLIT